MKNTLLGALLALSILGQAPAALAVGDGDLLIRLEVSKIVAQPGSETRQTAATSRPGDTLEYRATYTNRNKAVTRDVEATLPVPAGALVYLPDTARPAAVLASLDGKTFAPVPLTRIVIQPDGTKAPQPVPYAEYRYLRWPLGDLAPGAAVTVRARMQVNADISIATTREEKQP